MRKLILGLGNPGARYAASRHNLGFRVVAELARRRRTPLDRLECNSLVGGDPRMLLAAPQTYMNRSGYAARCLVERHGFEPGAILVVYDDVALGLGRVRLRAAGGPGGHRGMESVISSLRTEGVARLRLGIAPAAGAVPAGEELVGFVLEEFAPAERPAVEEMIGLAADACECWLADGAEIAMNRFNG